MCSQFELIFRRVGVLVGFGQFFLSSYSSQAQLLQGCGESASSGRVLSVWEKGVESGKLLKAA